MPRLLRLSALQLGTTHKPIPLVVINNGDDYWFSDGKIAISSKLFGIDPRDDATLRTLSKRDVRRVSTSIQTWLSLPGLPTSHTPWLWQLNPDDPIYRVLRCTDDTFRLVKLVYCDLLDGRTLLAGPPCMALWSEDRNFIVMPNEMRVLSIPTEEP